MKFGFKFKKKKILKKAGRYGAVVYKGIYLNHYIIKSLNLNIYIILYMYIQCVCTYMKQIYFNRTEELKLMLRDTLLESYKAIKISPREIRGNNENFIDKDDIFLSNLFMTKMVHTTRFLNVNYSHHEPFYTVRFYDDEYDDEYLMKMMMMKMM